MDSMLAYSQHDWFTANGVQPAARPASKPELARDRTAGRTLMDTCTMGQGEDITPLLQAMLCVACVGIKTDEQY